MTALNRAASQMLAPPTAPLLPPKVDTGTTGTGVDISAYEGLGIITLLTGAAAGSGIMYVLIEDSADNSSFALVAAFGPTGNGRSANTSGSNQALSYALDLDGCRQYVRASTVLVSGTSLIIGVALNAPKKVSG
jgi:hypothetical protein